jgi:hypothetical protein
LAVVAVVVEVFFLLTELREPVAAVEVRLFLF